jgi:MFS family permease
VLYITRGLGLTVQAASLAIGAGALVILAASPVSGKLGDRVGRARVMQVGLWVYGLGMIVPLLTSSPWIVAAVVPFVAFGGGVIMTLPYALLMPLMPSDRHGALSGFYSLSRGIGTALGPLLAGVAIALGRDLFAGTQGFAAMWAVCAAATLASIPLARRLGDDAD